jgi:hypothetical protein
VSVALDHSGKTITLRSACGTVGAENRGITPPVSWAQVILFLQQVKRLLADAQPPCDLSHRRASIDLAQGRDNLLLRRKSRLPHTGLPSSDSPRVKSDRNPS